MWTKVHGHIWLNRNELHVTGQTKTSLKQYCIIINTITSKTEIN